MNTGEDRFYAVTWDVLAHLRRCEETNYGICSAHRAALRLPVELDLRMLDCDIQPCRGTCPFDAMPIMADPGSWDA